VVAQVVGRAALLAANEVLELQGVADEEDDGAQVNRLWRILRDR
jgi:hypothetical protein